jgi:hypothetical protein
VELGDKLRLVYPLVLVGSEVQLLLGLNMLPRAEANQGTFLERFPDRMAIHYVDCFDCVHLIWFAAFTLCGALEGFRPRGEIDPFGRASLGRLPVVLLLVSTLTGASMPRRRICGARLHDHVHGICRRHIGLRWWLDVLGR